MIVFLILLQSAQPSCPMFVSLHGSPVAVPVLAGKCAGEAYFAERVRDCTRAR